MGFLQSLPMMYDTMRYGGKGLIANQHDMVSFFSPITNLGFYWDQHKLKLVHPGWLTPQITTETPWCHQRHGTSKRCGIDHNILFNLYGVIPRRCLECWKVCVTIDDFETLMTVFEMQKQQAAQHKFPCKCGIEVRDYTPKHYGAYYYADSLDEGYDMYDVVAHELKENVGDKAHAILKRGCTEFEFIKGPSPRWHRSPRDEKIEELIDCYLEVATNNNEQTELVKNHVFLKWMLWAHSNGDMTYKPWNGGKDLFPDYVSYHDKDRATMKQEVALARASALHNGVKPKNVKKVMSDLFKSGMKYGVDPNVILDMGINRYNKLQLEPTTADDPLSNIDKKLIGEQDELS